MSSIIFWFYTLPKTFSSFYLRLHCNPISKKMKTKLIDSNYMERLDTLKTKIFNFSLIGSSSQLRRQSVETSSQNEDQYNMRKRLKWMNEWKIEISTQYVLGIRNPDLKFTAKNINLFILACKIWASVPPT